MVADRDNDALDTPEIVAERARLDAALQGYADRQKELETTVRNRRIDLRDAKIELVEVRILFGTYLIQRLKPEITPYGQQTIYMTEKAREWGFKLSKAYDNLRYARLHQHDSTRYSSARLAELSVKEVRALHSQLGDDQVAIGRVSERLTAQDADNAVKAAALFIARTNQRDLRRMAGLQQQGVKTKAFRGWITGAVMRRGEPMTEEERSRGLSKLMVDSGAYTESTRGIGIDIDHYCAQLSANPWIKTYANLDKINPDLPEEGATVSYRNFKYMRERGLDPMPVYHDRENISWLEKYIHEEGCSYIGLGDVAGSTVKRNRVFFNQCFKVIRNAGRPLKVHAFGVAHESTLVDHPFASADSTAWLLQAQKARNSDLSRIGGAKWRASLYKPENNLRWYAATTFLEAYDAQRFERQIRENPERRDFCFYLVVPKADNAWWLPALWTVGHRNALVTNHRGWDPALVKQFIDDPASVLTQPRFAARLALLEEMKVRCYEYLYEQRRLQQERDRVRS